MTGFDSLTLDLEDWFDKPLSDLPDGLRERFKNQLLSLLWDSLSVKQRRNEALQLDYEADPACAEERAATWNEVSVDWDYWKQVPALTTQEFSILRLLHDPREFEHEKSITFKDAGKSLEELVGDDVRIIERTLGSDITRPIPKWIAWAKLQNWDMPSYFCDYEKNGGTFITAQDLPGTHDPKLAGNRCKVFRAMEKLTADEVSMTFVGDENESGMGNNMLEISARGVTRRVPLAELDLVDRRNSQPMRNVKLIRASEVKLESISWLWRDWLARGKFHVCGGAPGTGKTTICMAIAATVSRGGPWPDGTRSVVGNVVIWSGEDDPADTLIPRLILSGADLPRIYFIDDIQDGSERRSFDPARDMEPLRRRLEEIGDVHLLIVDPIVSAITGDSHKNAEVRRGLQPLVDLAASLGCALLGITHFTKGTGGRDPVERLTGSLAFGALARVVMVAAKHQEESEDGRTERLFCRAKSNIGPDGGGFKYDLHQAELKTHPGIHASSVQWGDPVEGSARELLAEADATSDDGGGGIMLDNNLLLKNIQQVFDEKRLNKISTADLIKALCEDEKSPWWTCNRGKQITPSLLAKQLQAYRITSKTIRLNPNNTAKGYELSQFDRVFESFKNERPDTKNLPSQGNISPEANNHGAFSVTDKKNVTVTQTEKVTAQAPSSLTCYAVTDVTDNSPMLGWGEEEMVKEVF